MLCSEDLAIYYSKVIKEELIMMHQPCQPTPN
ncbi:hypothetical protein PORUE0001_1185, partial [Porphyromonas uenonis 60-3]